MSVNRNKALFEMFRQGKVPIEPFVCIDAYNKKNTNDVFCTIRTTIDSSSIHFITLITDD